MSATGYYDVGCDPTAPPEPTASENAAARISVLRDASDVTFWLDLFDDIENLDQSALAAAMFAAHNGQPDLALEQLRAAVSSTLESLITDEALEQRAMMAAGPDPDAMREALRDEGSRA